MIINNTHYRTVWFQDNAVYMINQPLLPHKFEIIKFSDYRDVVTAITTMVVRGAPAIGATGAFGVALASIQNIDLRKAAQDLRNTRPTARDLFYGIDYVLNAVTQGVDAVQAANQVADQYIGACKKIGEYGAELLHNNDRINTHCNAGWLATVDWGTALSPVYKAKRQKKKVFVYVDETRPRCQGSRLTAFELVHENIPHAVITDNATGYYMKTGQIDLVIVGSDRIAVNGDVANKIGTYSSAVVAHENDIPFYVAAPTATIDKNCLTGGDIPIEQRADEEVTCMFGLHEGKIKTIQIAPKESKAQNPAFDVTPAKYISGIITERGIFKPHEMSKVI